MLRWRFHALTSDCRRREESFDSADIAFVDEEDVLGDVVVLETLRKPKALYEGGVTLNCVFHF
jgi:hypothetical protein